MRVPWSMTVETPDISRTTSAPRPSVAARTASTGSSFGGSIRTSAPIFFARSRRYSFGSTAIDLTRAGGSRDPSANRPIGPQPRTTTVASSTSSPPPEKTVCTALPNGSMIEADSAGMRGSTSHAFTAGITT